MSKGFSSLCPESDLSLSLYKCSNAMHTSSYFVNGEAHCLYEGYFEMNWGMYSIYSCTFSNEDIEIPYSRTINLTEGLVLIGSD